VKLPYKSSIGIYSLLAMLEAGLEMHSSTLTAKPHNPVIHPPKGESKFDEERILKLEGIIDEY
jgi:hypothetical protein